MISQIEEEKKEVASSHRLSEEFETTELFELKKGMQIEMAKVKQLFKVQKEAKKGNLIKNVSISVIRTIIACDEH